ncbi:MAG: fatty acid desaturase [Spirochaetota bacterium]
MAYTSDPKKTTINPSDYYSRDEIEAFGKEIDALYKKTKAKVSQYDLEEMVKLDTISTWFEFAGRGLIHFSPGPLTWLTGSILLAAHYIMEFSNGHNILHGHYDEFKHPYLNSENFKWDLTTDEVDWKFEHHTSHHPFTNVSGKDSDYGYLLFRANDDQPWHPRYLGQMGIFASVPIALDKALFPWYIATARAIVEKRKVLSTQTYGPSLQRIIGKLAKNYLFYPTLAGAFFPKVALGNLLADMMSNVHTILMLAVEHHNENIPLIELSPNETQADFYLRQTIATQNYKLPGWYEDLFTGSVNIHLEHHLFPDLPFNRLKEVAPEVERICKKHNVPYRNIDALSALTGTLSRLWEKSLPTRNSDTSLMDLLLNPIELFNRVIEGFQEKFIHLDALENLTFAPTKVKSVKKETADSTRVQLEIPKALQKTSIRGGQYISIKLKIDGKEHVRQYSLIEPKRPRQLEIIVKHVAGGLVSGYINEKLKVGDTISIVGGINGDFSYRPGSNQQVFVAGGVGITPVYSILRGIAKTGRSLENCILYYFNRDEKSVILQAELEKLIEKKLRIEYIYSNQTGEFFSNWFHREYNKQETIWGDVYACAPKGMLTHLKSLLDEVGFRNDRYHVENFAVDSHTFDQTGKKHDLQLLSSGKTVQWDEGEPLLQALEREGVQVASGCRKGMCKACLVKLEKGMVQRNGHPEELHSVYITSCDTYPRGKSSVWL